MSELKRIIDFEPGDMLASLDPQFPEFRCLVLAKNADNMTIWRTHGGSIEDVDRPLDQYNKRPEFVKVPITPEFLVRWVQWLAEHAEEAEA